MESGKNCGIMDLQQMEEAQAHILQKGAMIHDKL